MNALKSQIQNKIIFIDSCVLLYCEGKVFKSKIRQTLRELTNNNNQLLISEYSGFEVIKNSNPENFKYYIKLLDYIGNIPVSMRSLVNASILVKLYGTYKKEKNYGDYIIGGTVVHTKNALLLTANKKDFCSPYWKIIDRKYALYDIEERYEVLNIYLLEPDRDRITAEWKKIKDTLAS